METDSVECSLIVLDEERGSRQSSHELEMCEGSRTDWRPCFGCLVVGSKAYPYCRETERVRLVGTIASVLEEGLNATVDSLINWGDAGEMDATRFGS